MRIILFLLLWILPVVAGAQGVIRPKPPTPQPQKTETPQKQKPSTPAPTPAQSQSTQPNATVPDNRETINGITVRWASNATYDQKAAIRNLLNNMVFVQGGTYTMGSDSPSRYADERPAHNVTVSSFYIDKYEVTQKLWKAVMGSNPSYFSGDNLPVECVDYNQCKNFIYALNSLTGLNFRLPTEEEWEYAARGGYRQVGYAYSGSDNPDNVGWTKSNSGGVTHEVGKKQPNELGLYDMTGNVLEWTDSHGSAAYNKPVDTSTYIARGGSILLEAKNIPVTYRYAYQPSRAGYALGLRLVLSA